jgi:hypothetical protein
MTKKLHVLWKASLNSDGQQFHQYKQSKKVPPTTGYNTIPCHMTLNISTRAKCLVCVFEEPILEATIDNRTSLKHKKNITTINLIYNWYSPHVNWIVH